MPTITIVGAGPQMGLAVARTFGSHGFDVALLARNPDKLDASVGKLAAEGITAAAFPANVLDRAGLTPRELEGTGTGTQDWDNRPSLHSSWLRNPRAAPEVLLSCAYPANITRGACASRPIPTGRAAGARRQTG